MKIKEGMTMDKITISIFVVLALAIVNLSKQWPGNKTGNIVV